MSQQNFGEKVRIARILKGLSQQELGESVGVSRQYIHQIESNKIPSEDFIKVLEDSLSVTSDFFFKSAVQELKIDQCHFRKLKTTPVNLSNRVLAYGAILEEVLDFISKYIEFPECKLTEYAVGSEQERYSREEIEKTAENVRKSLNLGGNTPIDNMFRLLEHNGVLVSTLKGVSEKVDALSFDRRYAVILRNTAKESVCRMRFDLAHEMGHLVLHSGLTTGDARTEAEADHFASSLLFPRAAFIQEFNGCTSSRGSFRWSKILALKKRWKISQKAIIYRAHSLGLIDSRQYRVGNIHLNRGGQAKGEDFDELIPQERPELLLGCIEVLREDLHLSFTEICKSVGINPSYLNELLDLGIEPEYLVARTNISALPPEKFLDG